MPATIEQTIDRYLDLLRNISELFDCHAMQGEACRRVGWALDLGVPMCSSLLWEINARKQREWRLRGKGSNAD
jgi:hypothetical protein